MNFVNKFWLYSIFVLFPLWILIIIIVYKKYKKTVSTFFSLNVISKIISPGLFKIKKISFLIQILIFVLFLFVLSGPQWGIKPQEVKSHGIDIILAIDVSKSMLTEDVYPNRLEFVKNTCKILLDRIGANRVGIITFAGVAFYHCPLTNDILAAGDFLSIIDTDIVPYPGTKIAEALYESLRVLKETTSSNKVVILFSDGEDHGSYSPLILDEFKKNNIIVYTVGVGTPEGKPIAIRDEKGNIVDYKKDKQGNIITSRLNEELLYEIAEKTNGRYFSLTYGELGIAQQILEEITKIKTSQTKSKIYNLYVNRYHYFVYLIILLMLAEIFVPKSWLVKL
ncbi:MAG: VWA domain-containing protein [Endomicrobiia bacterium]